MSVIAGGVSVGKRKASFVSLDFRRSVLALPVSPGLSPTVSAPDSELGDPDPELEPSTFSTHRSSSMTTAISCACSFSSHTFSLR